MRTTPTQSKPVIHIFPRYVPAKEREQKPAQEGQEQKQDSFTTRWVSMTFKSQEEYEEFLRLQLKAAGGLLRMHSDSPLDLVCATLTSDLALDFTLDTIEISKDGQQRTFYVELTDCETDSTCKECGSKLVVNRRYPITLKHLPSGNVYQSITLQRIQYRCPKCKKVHTQEIPFRDADHRITKPLRDFICSLLAKNTFTYHQISELTGVDKNIIIKIHDKRLMEKHTEDESLKKPEAYSSFLCIGEFILHKGKKYATIIIDYMTGQVLWAQAGKKKKVVSDFIKHVGLEWMGHVKAVACDMNSDFEEGFLKECPHIKIVNDHFHLIKNLNENVIDKIRKDLIKEAKELGDIEGWELLKKTKFLDLR